MEKLTQNNLNQFTGTEEYFGHSILGTGKLSITSGCYYLRETGQCHWLFDIISSILPQIRGEEFWSVRLKKTGSAAVFTVDDGNGNILYTQNIGYTDFPLDEIHLFVYDWRQYGNAPVVMLPSEY
jgi:hypothetical protein